MNISKSSPKLPGKGNESPFDNKAMAIFQNQARANKVYQDYLNYLKTDVSKVDCLEDIPFMPIEFFKSHPIKTNDWLAEKVFESSGTTGFFPSRHYVKSLLFYHTNAQKIFETQFGRIKDKIILGLLPSYLERDNSSLVSMVDYFIRESGNSRSGFYLHEQDKLVELLTTLKDNTPIFLFGVTFALLDLAEAYELDLSHVTVIETGGMKGRREEIVKQELYSVLRQRLNLHNIYTEYGMTELLSQAYGYEGKMQLPATMKIFIRDINDPFKYLSAGKTGGVNIIDLANVDTCSFIETKDLGRINHDNSIEILGRFDNADIRGCNLMVS